MRSWQTIEIPSDLSFMTLYEEGPCRIVEDQNLKQIKIKLRDLQIPFISSAIEKFLLKCPMRFSTPEIVKGSWQINPHDFLELCHYIDMNFENELEVTRLKKFASQIEVLTGVNRGN